MINEFRIKSVGLDTTNLNYYVPAYYKDVESTYSYYITNVSSNNGALVSTVLPEDENYKLVACVNYLDNVSKSLIDHLEEMEKTSADILMIDSRCDFDKYFDEIKFIMDSRFADEIGIMNPEYLDLKKLEELRNLLNIKYIGMNISPLYYNVEVMNWAKNKDVLVMGFNPLGGYLSANLLVNTFTLPYLLKFAADNSDIVILSGRDVVSANINGNYLSSLIGQEKDDTSYVVKKTIDKLVKPLKTAGFTSLKVDNELFNISDPEVLFNEDEMKFNFGKPLEKIESGIETETELVKIIEDYLKEVKVPEDAKSAGDVMSSARPLVLKKIKNELEDKGWEDIVSVFYGDLYVISTYREFRIKHFFSKDKVTVERLFYLLYWSKDSGFVFRNVQNSITF